MISSLVVVVVVVIAVESAERQLLVPGIENYSYLISLTTQIASTNLNKIRAPPPPPPPPPPTIPLFPEVYQNKITNK